MSNATESRTDYTLRTVEDLRSHYDAPQELVIHKQVDRIDEYAAQFIAASPFFVFATTGPNGLDCSPKGDYPGFVRVLDEHTLAIPDRAGNNRIDGLQNIVQDPAVGMIFLVPGLGETFRVNGKAHVSVDPELLALFEGDAKKARSVIVVKVEEAFLHCGKALHYAQLWNPDSLAMKENVPNLKDMLQAQVAYTKEKAACD